VNQECGSEIGFIPKLQGYTRMGEKGDMPMLMLYDMPMLMLCRTILLMGVRIGNAMNNSNTSKE
jgi:hypothetical protein